ncbi:MAG: hypothetical protein ACOYNI_12435 [Acidimicrobiia bacterium]
MPSVLLTADDVLETVVLTDAEARALAVLASPTADPAAVTRATGVSAAAVVERLGNGDRMGARALWWKADILLARRGEALTLPEPHDREIFFSSGESELGLGQAVERARAELESGVLQSRQHPHLVERAARVVGARTAIALGLDLAAASHRLGNPGLERRFLEHSLGAFEQWSRFSAILDRRFTKAEVLYRLAHVELADEHFDAAFRYASAGWTHGRGAPNPARDAGLARILAATHAERGNSRRSGHWLRRAEKIRLLANQFAYELIDTSAPVPELLERGRAALVQGDIAPAIASFATASTRSHELPDDDARGRLRLSYMQALREFGLGSDAAVLHERGNTERPSLQIQGELAVERALAERDRSIPQARRWLEIATMSYDLIGNRMGQIQAQALLDRVVRQSAGQDTDRRR